MQYTGVAQMDQNHYELRPLKFHSKVSYPGTRHSADPYTRPITNFKWYKIFRAWNVEQPCQYADFVFINQVHNLVHHMQICSSLIKYPFLLNG